MILSSYTLECEIIHTFGASDIIQHVGDTSTPVYYPDGNNKYFPIYDSTITSYSGSDYAASILFDNFQLHCELEINEVFNADNTFKLSVWNLVDSDLVTINDILRVTFYWQEESFFPTKYYANMVIETVTKTTDANGIKLVLTGTTIIDYIFKSMGVIHSAGQVDFKSLSGIIQTRFGLTTKFNIGRASDRILTRGKSITDLLNELCDIYTENNNGVNCTWYVFGNTIIIQDTIHANEQVEFLTPIIDYNDIIKLEVVDESIESEDADNSDTDNSELVSVASSTTKKSLKLNITGIPTLRKESFVTMKYSNVLQNRELNLPTENESFIVTEVSHILSPDDGYYSTVYCYNTKHTENANDS